MPRLPLSSSTSPAIAEFARLRRIARLARALIAAGAAGLVAGTLWDWSLPEHALHRMEQAASVARLDEVTPLSQALGALWTLVPVAILLLASCRLWGLFGEYAQARVFSHRALVCLRGFARCLLATAFVSPLYGAVLSVIATWVNGPGRRELNLQVDWSDFGMLLFGIVVLAIASVMAEAARVAQEHAGFV